VAPGGNGLKIKYLSGWFRRLLIACRQHNRQTIILATVLGVAPGRFSYIHLTRLELTRRSGGLLKDRWTLRSRCFHLLRLCSKIAVELVKTGDRTMHIRGVCPLDDFDLELRFRGRLRGAHTTRQQEQTKHNVFHRDILI